MRTIAPLAVAALSVALSLSSAHAQSQGLLSLKAATEAAMRDCDLAFQKFSDGVRGQTSLPTMSSLALATEVECGRAEETIVQIDEFPGETYAVRDKVRMWLFSQRNVANYRQLSTGLVVRLIRFRTEREWANENGRRLAADSLATLEKSIEEDEGRVALIPSFWTEAVEAVAAEERQPPKLRKPAPATGRKLVEIFVARQARAYSECAAASEELRRIDLASALKMQLVVLARKTMNRCDETGRAISAGKTPPRAVGRDASERLDDWVDELSRVTRAQRDAAQSMLHFAEDGNASHLKALRASTIAALAHQVRAQEVLRETYRELGMKFSHAQN